MMSRLLRNRNTPDNRGCLAWNAPMLRLSQTSYLRLNQHNCTNNGRRSCSWVDLHERRSEGGKLRRRTEVREGFVMFSGRHRIGTSLTSAQTTMVIISVVQIQHPSLFSPIKKGPTNTDKHAYDDSLRERMVAMLVT